MRGNNTDDPSWIHPGTFCTKCDWGILVEHVPPELAEMRDEDFPEYYDIRLIDAGPNRLALMQLLRQVCPMSPSEAKRRISQVPSVIGRVRWTQIEGLEERFSQLGATVELEGIEK